MFLNQKGFNSLEKCIPCPVQASDWPGSDVTDDERVQMHKKWDCLQADGHYQVPDHVTAMSRKAYKSRSQSTDIVRGLQEWPPMLRCHFEWEKNQTESSQAELSRANIV